MIRRQQFIFNKTIGITTVLFKNINPLLYVEQLVFYKEILSTGVWLKQQFRYSFDNIVWSSWATLSQLNIQNIQFRDNPNFFIEILYTRQNYNTASIEELYIIYDSNDPTPVDPGISDIDAATLQGQPGSYYLDRANFTGPYTDLIVSNVVDGSSAGVYYGRTDSSVGTELFFKRIDGTGGITITDTPAGKIIIDASNVVIGKTYQNSNPVNQTVGGISSGETFFSSEKTFAETMEAIFYPTLYPTFTNPYNSFSFNVNNLQEIGDLIDIQFTTSFNKGTITPAYGTNGYRSGDPSVYYYTGTGLPSSFPETSPSNIQNVFNYDVSIGIQTWTSYVYYKEGPQPLDSNGDPYLTPYPQGNTGSLSVSLEGVYPLFATTVNITTLTKQTLVSMSTSIAPSISGMNLISESGGNKQKFEIPNAWLLSKPLLGIKTFNTVSNQWQYELNSADLSLTRWDTSAVVNIIQGYSIPYTRYTYNGPDRSVIQIRLEF